MRARGVVSDRQSGRRIEAHTFAPSDDMRELVATFWSSSWDLRGQPPHDTGVLPDPCVNLVIEAGRSRVIGAWTGRFSRRLEDQGRIIAAKLNAGAFRAFVAHPVARYTDVMAPIASVLSGDWLEIEREVLAAPDDAQACARFEEVLRGMKPTLDDRSRIARQVWETIAADPYRARVEVLAKEQGVSVRSLQRIFREYVGLHPKAAVKRARLQELARRIERDPEVHLARLAGELGYTDQAHLARDVKEAVEMTPSQLARRVRS